MTRAVSENFTQATIDCFEPLLVAAPEQPAALKIEAGRYYKTRDGRKVGPIGPNEGGLAEYPWQDNSDWTDCWTTDGRFYNDGTESQHDIVAEWIDEPVAVAASNDNTPSTAGFTIPLVDEDPAAGKDGSAQLTVRITSDFTELHEQIDYAFERLKKLKKKARKLGI